MNRSVRLSVGAAVLAFAFASGAGVAEASFSAHGSVEQVYVTGLAPGAQMSLLDRDGRTVATKRADALGGLLFRNVKPGGGYRVRRSPRGAKSGPLTVLSTRSAPPSTDVYDQEIPANGYGYLTTRDGTKLAIYVHPPQDVTNAAGAGLPPPQVPAGPTPTLIEYSGYGYANPAGPQSGISILANLMGFTVVDVNMRGTGCSGGAFDFFEPLQSLDGYDVIETVARQPWVKHDKVGMMGISYGGISQLFTAQTNPPSLAAISPLSVIDATQTTLYPGRHPEHRLRRQLGQGARPRGQAGRPRGGPGLGLQADPGGRPDLQGQPGAARRGRRPAGQDPRQQPLQAQGGRPALADHVRPQDQGADLHGLPVDRRADGRPLPDAGRALHRHEPQVVHVHQRHARRLARPGDLQPLVRLPPALRRQTGADHELRDRSRPPRR